MANTVYWIGADGNVYYRNGDTVQNVGRPIRYGEGGFDAERLSAESRLIADPNPPSAVNNNLTPPQNNNTVTGPTAAQLAPLDASLKSLPTVRTNRMSTAQQTYDRNMQDYKTQDALDKVAYDKNIQQNNENLASQRQAGLLNAVRGGEGLRAVLSSLGALAGSGQNIARRLVGLAANSDLGSADKTYETNADNLFQSWQTAEQQQRQRRADADAQLKADRQNAEADVLNSEKKIYETYASTYGSSNPKGLEYAAKAAALAPRIAATTAPSVGRYAAPSSLFSPAALQNYLAGTKNLSVSTDGGSTTPINSPLYSSEKRKDRLSSVA